LQVADLAAATRSRRLEISFQFHLDYIFKENLLNNKFPVKFQGKRTGFRFYTIHQKIDLFTSTSCRDTWKESLVSGCPPFYLATLEKGMSLRTINEIIEHKVKLVVPSKYHPYYPLEIRNHLMSLSDFCNYMATQEVSLDKPV
jgi:hypothetical protein